MSSKEQDVAHNPEEGVVVDSEAWVRAAASDTQGKDHICVVCLLERIEDESRARLYTPRLGSGSLLLLAVSGRCQLGSAAPGGGVGGSALVRSMAPPILGILPA